MWWPQTVCLFVSGVHGLSVHAHRPGWFYTGVPHRAAAAGRRPCEPARHLYRERRLHRDWGESGRLLQDAHPANLRAHRWNLPPVSVFPQWFLIKQQAYKVSLAGSLFFAGLLIGNVVFGPLSDKIGRRPVYLTGEVEADDSCIVHEYVCDVSERSCFAVYRFAVFVPKAWNSLFAALVFPLVARRPQFYDW